jgi:hypothetical protein
MTRTFQTRVTGRRCDNFGAVDYVITDVIVERDDGLEVTSTSRGVAEGSRVDEHSVRRYRGVTLEAAAAYRLRNGYVEVKS